MISIRTVGLIIATLGSITYLLSVVLGGLFFPIGPEGVTPQTQGLLSLLNLFEICGLGIIATGLIIILIDTIKKRKKQKRLNEHFSGLHHNKKQYRS